jgi:hypothetical protein
MENGSVFYGHMEYFTVIWYILWPFGNAVVIWYIFPRLCQENLVTQGKCLLFLDYSSNFVESPDRAKYRQFKTNFIKTDQNITGHFLINLY